MLMSALHGIAVLDDHVAVLDQQAVLAFDRVHANAICWL